MNVVFSKFILEFNNDIILVLCVVCGDLLRCSLR